jgi:fermentation-respiration switch protein FrsA (DUF1100 family)
VSELLTWAPHGIPLLIIHGTDDHTIPFAQGKRLFEAATTKQKHFCALAGEDRNPTQMWNGLWRQFGKTNQDIDFADHAWEFFKRHPKH